MVIFSSTDEEITFVQGNKGSIYPQLIARNYIYYRYRGALPNEHYWKCSLYDRGVCKARCTTYDNNVEFYGPHTHPPDLERIANRIVISKLKVKVKKCQDGEFRSSKNTSQNTELPTYMRLPEKDKANLNIRNFMRHSESGVNLAQSSQINYTLCQNESTKSGSSLSLPDLNNFMSMQMLGGPTIPIVNIDENIRSNK